MLRLVLTAISTIGIGGSAGADDGPPFRLVTSRAAADSHAAVVTHSQLPTLPTLPVTADEAEQHVSLQDEFATDGMLHYPERLHLGYTLVLPGVLGHTPYNSKLVRLLDQAPTAVELFDWTAGVPLFKRRGLKRNEFNLKNVDQIVDRIIRYQHRYPDRPVRIFALCAGAGVACEALARLPHQHRIRTAVLLGPALSPDYDLRPALRGTTDGIDSFHSPLDIPVLMALTTVTGTVDGRHMPAAGAIGFGFGFDRMPQLRQHMYNPKMLTQGHFGGHFGWTATRFFEVNLLPMYDDQATASAVVAD